MLMAHERKPSRELLVEECKLVVAERQETERIVEHSVAWQRHDLRLSSRKNDPRS